MPLETAIVGMQVLCKDPDIPTPLLEVTEHHEDWC